MPKVQSHMDDATVAEIIALTELALAEDIGSSDLARAIDCTTLAVVPDEIKANATFVARDCGFVAGIELAEVVIRKFAPDLKVNRHCNDGDEVTSLAPIATLSGEARKILMMERTCLNFMCRLSGIATLTAEYVKLCEGSQAQILDTRKTTPGWRRIEKYAVSCGGGSNHRMGLYDAVMIKDNHIAMYGNHIDNHRLSVSEAINLAKDWVSKNSRQLPNGEQTIVQIEVDTLEQLNMALPANPDIVLLDNMNIEQLEQAVRIRDELNPKVLLEASGGVNLNTVAAISKTGVERISVGALTHSARNFDIGLDWELEKHTR